jgi:hypothetical protein
MIAPFAQVYLFLENHFLPRITGSSMGVVRANGFARWFAVPGLSAIRFQRPALFLESSKYYTMLPKTTEHQELFVIR